MASQDIRGQHLDIWRQLDPGNHCWNGSEAHLESCLPNVAGLRCGAERSGVFGELAAQDTAPRGCGPGTPVAATDTRTGKHSRGVVPGSGSWRPADRIAERPLERRTGGGVVFDAPSDIDPAPCRKRTEFRGARRLGSLRDQPPDARIHDARREADCGFAGLFGRKCLHSGVSSVERNNAVRMAVALEPRS